MSMLYELTRLGKSRIIETVLELLPAGHRRRALENGNVRILGCFVSKCGRVFLRLRAVDYPGGHRRVTHYAIGGFEPLAAGIVDPPDWRTVQFLEPEWDVAYRTARRLLAWKCGAKGQQP